MSTHRESGTMMKKTGFFGRSELTAALWAFRREFLIVGIFSMVANVLMLTPTVYMLQVYDRVMISQSELTLIAVSLVALFLFAVMGFAEFSRSRVLVRAGMRLDEQLSTRVFNASFEAYLSQSGANPSRAFADLTELRQFLTGSGIFGFFDAPWTPIYIAVLFVLHPLLGWLAVFFAIVQCLLAWFGHRSTVAPIEAANLSRADVHQYLQSKLRNSEVLESMGMVGNLRNRWNLRHQAYLADSGVAQGVSQKVAAWSKFIRYSQQSLALGAGALLVIDGQLSVGAMIAANVLTTRALAPIDMLASTWRNFLSARSAFRRLETLLDAHPERDPALTRVPPTGAITLHNVFASAEGREMPILKGVSLRGDPGTVTVVLGPSGSGKSTLARVMVGIWPDVSGEVLLDDGPIEGWSRTDLGPHIGYLPQDVELFEGSIAENIARFSEVNPQQVIAAARSAGLHEMILRFPKGYDTPIGEAGGMLSGGQRQRIGLARAIYGDPALVVLDEPNANLDDAGEAALVKTVSELKGKGKTIFLITHRPGALSVADRLVILRDGEVQIHGPRDEVIAAMRPPSVAPRAAPGTSLQPA
jgi:ATP-binding cassette, subfamily C, bacterial exporter for protease/lipase